MKSAIFALLAMVAGGCCGAVSVTASRDYVDKKTMLHPVEESGTTNVVGYFLGTQTNKVLISEYGISKNTPGDYYNVSNAAMNARSKTDLNVYTNSASESESPIVTGDKLATTGEVAEAMSSIKTDLITDGTNTIDAAGNVTRIVYRDAWMGSDGNVFTNVIGTTRWISIYPAANPSYDDSMAGYVEWAEDALEYIGEEGAGWYFNNDDSSDTPYGEVYAGPLTATSLPGLSRGDYSQVSKLALTNDIPPAIQVVSPSTNAPAGTAADAKATGTALYTGFTDWLFSDGLIHYLRLEEVSGEWYWWSDDLNVGSSEYFSSEEEANNALSLTFQPQSATITATRRIVTPTKTSQLTNDGPSSGPNVGHPFATTNQIPAPVDISGKLDGAAAYPAWGAGTEYHVDDIVFHNGFLWRWPEGEDTSSGTPEPGSEDDTNWAYFTLGEAVAAKQDALSLSNYAVPQYPTPKQALLSLMNSHVGVIIGGTKYVLPQSEKVADQLLLKANSADVATALAQKASLTDLPYRLVELGWLFSGDGVQEGHTYTVDVAYGDGSFTCVLKDNGTTASLVEGSCEPGEQITTVDFEQGSPSVEITASFDGHLLDRSGNLVEVSGDTTLTLPALVNAGKARDFLVRLEISGSTVPTITFAAPTGETITYETDGDEFPVPDEAGTWLYSFTETAAHKFAVSLKKVNEVAAPQAQGGS